MATDEEKSKAYEEYNNLMSYNSLSFEELKERKEALTKWLHEEYEDVINSLLLMQAYKPISVDLQDGLLYTIDFDYNLTCHGFKEDSYCIKSYSLVKKYCRLDKLTIIADRIGKGDYSNPDEFYAPFAKEYEYYPEIRSNIDEITLSGVERLDKDTIQIKGGLGRTPKVGLINLPDIVYLGKDALENLAIGEIRLPDKPVELVTNGMVINMLKKDRLWLNKSSMSRGVRIEKVLYDRVEVLNKRIGEKVVAVQGSSTFKTIDGPKVTGNFGKIVEAPNCEEVRTNGFERSACLKEIHLPRCKRVEYEGINFCLNLEYVDLRGLDINKSWQYAPIKNCPNVKRVVLPKEFEGTDILRDLRDRAEYV